MAVSDMTRAALLKRCDEVEEARRCIGQDPSKAWVVLTMPRRRFRTWDVVKVAPGLYGRHIGFIDAKRSLVEVKAPELREWLAEEKP